MLARRAPVRARRETRTRAASPLGLAAALLFVVAACSCSGGDSSPSAGDSCTALTPSSCPSPAPGYAARVEPIVAKYCGACHASGGVEASVPLDSYAALVARETSVLGQLDACAMPPAGNPQLSDEDRGAVLAWLVCGAHDD